MLLGPLETQVKPFSISHGVEQCCVLAPTLFSLYLAAAQETMCTNLNSGVFIKTRTDDKLFNLAKLRASTKTKEICVRELLYADDSAFVATDSIVTQVIADRFSCAARHFGMEINVPRTELLYQPPPNKPPTYNDIILNRSALQKVEHFTYLESTVTNSNSSDLEVDRRIQAANIAFESLQQRLWSRHDIKLTTKIKVY